MYFKYQFIYVNSDIAILFIVVQRTSVGERSVNMVNHFLELTAREIKTIVGSLCERRVALQQQVCVCVCVTF